MTELPTTPARASHRKAYTLLAFLLCSAVWFYEAGNLLISSDPLPDHLDGLIVLQGSVVGQDARLAGAVRSLKERGSGRILMSIPHETYWGQLVRPLALRFVENHFGDEIAQKVEFCETNAEVDSTEQEAVALLPCIKQLGWRDVAVVTSDYHTRRAGIIWRRLLKRQNDAMHLWIHGVPDPEFDDAAWWRERVSAKTVFFEYTKLLSILFR